MAAASNMELVMRQVDWRDTGQQPNAENLPYATHSGVLEIMGRRLRCYRLNTGQAVFHADDMHQFFDLSTSQPEGAAPPQPPKAEAEGDF